MHHGMIDFQKNKLLDHAGEPEDSHAKHKKPAHGCGGQFLGENKTDQPDKDK